MVSCVRRLEPIRVGSSTGPARRPAPPRALRRDALEQFVACHAEAFGGLVSERRARDAGREPVGGPLLGVEFDPQSSWDEKREIWKIADVIYKTKEVTQTAIGNKDGLWTTVVTAAVLLP